MYQADLLKGHKILVTGGGTGLGKSMTEKYLSLGAECIIWGRRASVLEETANELHEKTGGTISWASVDIRNPMAIEEAVEKAFAGNPLTGLVNNAAGNFISRTEDLSANAFNAIASIVFHGTFNTTNAVGKKWIAQKLKGSVISIVTTWVWTGGPFTVPSAMSKAGVNAMTQSLASEWGPKGIRLNAIAPGPFPTKGAWERLMPQTDAMKGMGSVDGTQTIPLRRMGRHDELANLAVFLMSEHTEYLTGECIAIDGGQWLNSAGNFHQLSALGDAEWEAIRGMIQATNAKDKSARTPGA
jgi:NAD(P)-dependent dehydrogenase (short-subunit alcohol dehydrogenase family)